MCVSGILALSYFNYVFGNYARIFNFKNPPGNPSYKKKLGLPPPQFQLLYKINILIITIKFILVKYTQDVIPKLQMLPQQKITKQKYFD